jgi:hypothetical protein
MKNITACLVSIRSNAWKIPNPSFEDNSRGKFYAISEKRRGKVKGRKR